MLPNRQSLANYFIFLSQTAYPIDGAADHGYSEAIYLTDPEGNGIEIYADKPVEKWDIRPDGQIAGVTEPLDVMDLFSQASSAQAQLPKNTFIGHIHLSVMDIEATKQFLTKELLLDVVYHFGHNALFLSHDRYHHQIAINTWSNPQFPNDTTQPGLKKITVLVSKRIFSDIQHNVTHDHLSFNEGDQQLILTDPNGFIYQIIHQ